MPAGWPATAQLARALEPHPSVSGCDRPTKRGVVVNGMGTCRSRRTGAEALLLKGWRASDAGARAKQVNIEAVLLLPLLLLQAR